MALLHLLLFLFVVSFVVEEKEEGEEDKGCKAYLLRQQ